MRIVIILLIAILPWAVKKRLLEWFFGYKFADGSRIGFAVVDCKNLDMREYSYIGSFTVIRNLKHLELGRGAKIGTFNWIFGMLDGGLSFKEEVSRNSSLILGNHSAITSRHIIDCIDRIEIGNFSTIAGFKSQFLTHAVDLRLNRQSCAPIKIGDYCFVGTGVIILKGVEIPNRCVVGAGSVVSKTLPNPGYVYAGNPLKMIREINQSEGYFIRMTGKIR